MLNFPLSDETQERVKNATIGPTEGVLDQTFLELQAIASLHTSTADNSAIILFRGGVGVAQRTWRTGLWLE